MSLKVRFWKWMARKTAEKACKAATNHAIDLKEREDNLIRMANQTRPKFQECRKLWEDQSE